MDGISIFAAAGAYSEAWIGLMRKPTRFVEASAPGVALALPYRRGALARERSFDWSVMAPITGNKIAGLWVQSTPSASPAPLPDSDALRGLMARLPAVVYTCGPPPEFPTTFVSPNVEELLGYPPHAFYADPFFWTNCIHPAQQSRILGVLSAIGDRNSFSYEYQLRKSNGQCVWLHDEVSVLREQDRRIIGLVGAWFEITKRKRLESLQLGQARVLEHLVRGHSLEDTLEEIVRVLEGQATDMLCSILRFDAATQTLRHGAAPSLPEEYNRQIDGMKIGRNAGSCGSAAFRKERVVVTDTHSDALWRDFRDLAAQFGLRACWSQPILSSRGELLGTFAMYYRQPRGPVQEELDLIERAANLAALAIERFLEQEALRQTGRLASLGTLAAGIAHEINNPMSGILLAAQAAMRANQLNKPLQVGSLLENIVSDTERSARIVRGILQFSQRSTHERQTASLNRIVQTACDLTQGYARSRRATVQLLLSDENPEILCCVTEIEQVLVNLIRNAVESTENGATIQVRTEADSHSVHFSVGDDGRGMDEQQTRRIFDPFFTTRQREGGTGLGMSIVHGIVAAHAGAIQIRSKPQQGTTVVVSLPRKTPMDGANQAKA